MDNIKEKLKKIKELAERGEQGEAEAAQAQLEKLLDKYNLTIEDVFDDKTTNRLFKITRDEFQLFLQTLASVIGNKAGESYYFRGDKTKIYVTLTEIEYIYFSQLFEFHRKQYKLERKNALKKLELAYMYKHDLFNKDKEAVDVEESKMTYEEYQKIIRMKDTLEDVSFHKQLN